MGWKRRKHSTNYKDDCKVLKKGNIFVVAGQFYGNEPAKFYENKNDIPLDKSGPFKGYNNTKNAKFIGCETKRFIRPELGINRPVKMFNYTRDDGTGVWLQPGDYYYIQEPSRNSFGSVKNKRKFKFGEDCPICMEDMEGCNTRACANDHKYHRRCLNRWARNNPNCPLCRDTVREQITGPRSRTRTRQRERFNDRFNMQEVFGDDHNRNLALAHMRSHPNYNVIFSNRGNNYQAEVENRRPIRYRNINRDEDIEPRQLINDLDNLDDSFNVEPGSLTFRYGQSPKRLGRRRSRTKSKRQYGRSKRVEKIKKY